MELATFTAEGFQPVQASSPQDAARTFAERQARREYGSKGVCASLTLGSYTEDRRSYTFQAFIGTRVPRDRATPGRNVWLYIRRIGGDSA